MDETPTQLFREALAWGKVYGPEMAPALWDEMRDSMADEFNRRLELLCKQKAESARSD